MPEIQTKDKLITLEELGAAINAKAGVTSVNSQTGAVSITPANIGALAVDGSNAMHQWITIDTSFIDNNGAGIDIAMSNGKHWYLYPTGTGDNFSIGGYDGTTWFWTLRADMTTGSVSLHNPLGIISGGTGATTPAQARANLELTPSASQMIATGIYVIKVGNLAFVACDGSNVIALPPLTWVTLGYLPNGYVPVGHFYGTVSNGVNAEQLGIMHITDSGTIQYYNSGTAQSTALWGSITFPISNN